MQNIIALEVLVSVSENGFSLDELVMATRQLFEEKGIPGLIGLVLRLLDENLCLRLRQNHSDWKPTSCCAQPDYEFQDWQPRRLKRIAFGWSPAGAAKMARIIIKRFTSAAQWDTYWQNRLKITGQVIMALTDIRVASPQPLGR